MSLVPLVERETAPAAVADLFETIHAAFGTVPAMFRAVANSPAALASMWASFSAFGGGELGPALSEQIAVAVADRNSCEYCLAAHTALGRKAGVSGAAMLAAQEGRSEDPRTEALLGFALKLVDQRGHVTPTDVEALRAQGYGDAQIVEVIGQVALNLFTNYINVALAVPVDFLPVRLLRAR
ncbi:carboxymuconolactone decarboxylase family protein [Nocardia bovistercoris]|uniref:Peroxidase-related enzyme n=1 Tax=Nocardia bovistercoris TaxID=2785916 RepID=A0A931IA36_9NOCA|nr:peroxidase-related enzyme [Nocardia bovistercoris]MBH0777762.1 peroxidase-related enzyme [Nocardia bovistercoris]